MLVPLMAVNAILLSSEKKEVSYNRKLPPIYINVDPTATVVETILVSSETEQPTASPEVTPTSSPTLTPTETCSIVSTPTETPTPTIEPTVEVTATPIPKEKFETSIPSRGAQEPNWIVGKFETDRLYVTSYSYTDPVKTQIGGSYYYDGAASPYCSKLIPIYDNSSIEIVDGKKYIVHSIASEGGVNSGTLPFGSIIYIPKLDMYFRMDDTCGSYSKSKTSQAWKMGASFWIDIYVGRAAYEDLSHGSILNYGSGINVAKGIPNRPNSGSIKWADGYYNFSKDELGIIEDFWKNYYNSKPWTFKLLRYGLK